MFLDQWLDSFLHTTPWTAFAISLALNTAVFAGSLFVGALLQRLFASRAVSPPPSPITSHELALAACTVFLNSVVLHAGWLLWRAKRVHLEPQLEYEFAALLGGLFGAVLIALVMDGLMYALHRVAHHRLVYSLLHAPHHRYSNVRPLTLFVLHPAETLAFGGLWLVVLLVLQPGWWAIVFYLSLNTLFGVVGHTGVEPIPPSWSRFPLLNRIAGGEVHARHHQEPTRAFGFYTTVWDRLFKTE
ncbi:MAG: sterol desaturase family protein [Deltaproteobacteria bacterium]|nr:sterol desaturase family protein [Deltaproteobacteria bacterium]